MSTRERLRPYVCAECRGSGVFDRIETDDIPCPACKGSGVAPRPEKDARVKMSEIEAQIQIEREIFEPVADMYKGTLIDAIEDGFRIGAKWALARVNKGKG